MNLTKNFLKVVGLVFLITLIGCSDKKQEEADRAAQEQARINTQRNEQQRQKALIKTNAAVLLKVVLQYGTCLEGIGNSADKVISALNQAIELPSFKKAQEVAPDRAAENLRDTASEMYGVFQKTIGRLLEVLDDVETDKNLATVRAFVREMPNGKDKDTFTKGIESCEKAKEWINKYQQRKRYEVGDQIQQMKKCSEQLRPTFLDLAAVGGALYTLVDDDKQ